MNSTAPSLHARAMPPAVPRRHPHRLTIHDSHGGSSSSNNNIRGDGNRSNGNGTHGVTDEQVEQWERAVLLHHTFDLTGAAHAFSQLSKTINPDVESTLCLLNAGIIHSRLGNFKLAAEILDQAAHVDETLALTLLMMGNAEFHLRNIAKAKDCWQIALNTLNEEPREYSSLGLDFELTPASIEYNLDLLWAKQSHPEKASQLFTLPSSVVFEAPVRTPDRERSSFYEKPKSSSSGSRISVEAGITALPMRSGVAGPRPLADTRLPMKSVEYAREQVVCHASPERPIVQRRVSTYKNKPASSSTFGNLMRQWQAHRRQSSALRYGDWTFRQEVETDPNAFKAGVIPPVPPLPIMSPPPPGHAAVAAPAPTRKVNEARSMPTLLTQPAPGLAMAQPAPPRPLPTHAPRQTPVPTKTPSPSPLSGHVEIVSPREIAAFFRRNSPDAGHRPAPPTIAPIQTSPLPPPPSAPSAKAELAQPVVDDDDDDASVYSDDGDSSRHDSMVSDESPGSKSSPSTPSTPYMGNNMSYTDHLRSAQTACLPIYYQPEVTVPFPARRDPGEGLRTFPMASPYPEPSTPLPPVPARSASRKKVVPMLPRIHEFDTYTPATHPALRHPPTYYYQEGGMF